MTDLLTWLRARLDEDEQVARGATAGPWEALWHGVQTAYEYDRPGYIHHGERVPIARNSGTVGNREAEVRNVEHIAHWDPARVLAEVDAKRRILDLHSPGRSYREDGKPVCASCRKSRIYPCQVVRLLALPMAGREGYREEWRP